LQELISIFYETALEAPNIAHVNTLQENIRDLQEKDRFNVVLANPPFGGKERVEVQQNFPIKSGETAFLFLQHFIAVLKAGGIAPRCGLCQLLFQGLAAAFPLWPL
jgi:type I restriction-modification system DNA methylase subunit